MVRFLAFCCLFCVVFAWDESIDRVMWEPAFDPWLYTSVCNIDKVGFLSKEEFDSEYLQQKPVIFHSSLDNSLFSKHTTKDYLLEKYGAVTMMLSAANTFSYKREYITLREYITNEINPQDLNTSGEETFYLFGGNHRTIETELFPEYKRPPFADSDSKGSLSFGIAGSGSGVPLHRHGHVFAEVFYGMKRWFLYHPDSAPNFDPDASTIQWLQDIYPTLDNESRPLECVLRPGEVIYLPDWWWHGTLNIGETVFISTFV